MSLLDSNPPCRCCSTLRQYTARHLDPGGRIRASDDPAETLALLDRCFPDEGGAGIDLEDITAYIEALKEDTTTE